MQKVLAVYVGGGRLEARGPHDMEILECNYAIGGTLKLAVTKPRSGKQMRFFFAWLKQVFDNLPEDCPEHFQDQDHLRAWMAWRAGKCRVLTLPAKGFGRDQIRVIRRLARSPYLFFEYTETTVFVYEPDSIAMEGGMEQKVFNEFFTTAKELALLLIPGLDLEALEAHVYKQDLKPN